MKKDKKMIKSIPTIKIEEIEKRLKSDLNEIDLKIKQCKREKKIIKNNIVDITNLLDETKKELLEKKSFLKFLLGYRRYRRSLLEIDKLESVENELNSEVYKMMKTIKTYREQKEKLIKKTEEEKRDIIEQLEARRKIFKLTEHDEWWHYNR